MKHRSVWQLVLADFAFERIYSAICSDSRFFSFREYVKNNSDPNIVVVEGGNCVGKSKLIGQLSDAEVVAKFPTTGRACHFRRPEEYISDMAGAKNALTTGKKTYIDRFWLSTLVYQTLSMQAKPKNYLKTVTDRMFDTCAKIQGAGLPVPGEVLLLRHGAWHPLYLIGQELCRRAQADYPKTASAVFAHHLVVTEFYPLVCAALLPGIKISMLTQEPGPVDAGADNAHGQEQSVENYEEKMTK